MKRVGRKLGRQNGSLIMKKKKKKEKQVYLKELLITFPSNQIDSFSFGKDDGLT